MKKSSLLAFTSLLLSALLLLGGCSNTPDPNAPEGYQTASNDKVSYTLFVPTDWVVDTDEDSLMTEARVSAQDTANITMMAYDATSQYLGQTDEEGKVISPVTLYWADNLENLQKLFDNDAEGNSTFKLESDGQTTLMGKTAKGENVPAYSYVYTATLGGVELKYMQVIACYKDSFYFFTYTASAERYSEYADQVNAILGYIVFD